MRAQWMGTQWIGTQGSRDELLVVPESVAIGSVGISGVDEGDPRVERGMDGGDRAFLVERCQERHRHPTEAERAHLGVPDPALIHRSPSGWDPVCQMPASSDALSGTGYPRPSLVEMSEKRAHHRPALPGARNLEEMDGGTDPGVLSEAADRCATLLVRGANDADDAELVGRVVHLADTEGLEPIADLWSGSPADSVAGTLWRLYLLRAWVYADPVTAAHEFEVGSHAQPVDGVVAGVPDPPGPDEVRNLLDAVLRGVVAGDYADTLFRASAFARVVAAGRARAAEPAPYANDLSASRLLTLADQLRHAATLELRGELG